MTVVEMFIGLIMIGVVYIIIKLPEWRSNYRLPEEGKHMDFEKINIDRANGMTQRDIDIKTNKGGYDVGNQEVKNETINWMYGGKSK